ncbi:hypothetical protein DPMN_024799, partial [Dreissena polymorpha]
RCVRSLWCSGYGVRLAIGMSRVRSPLRVRSLDFPRRHQHLKLSALDFFEVTHY